jgi:hypothetical protein
MPRTVRFHEIGDASVLRLEEEPLQDPGPGQVRFRVEALGFMFADSLFRPDSIRRKRPFLVPASGTRRLESLMRSAQAFRSSVRAIGSRASRTSRSWISPCIARARCFPRGA